MDRIKVYDGQIPYAADLLNTNRNTMVALSKLAAAVFGTGSLVNGFSCAPTVPASMNVTIGAGEIYQMEVLDATAYSTLAADTAHNILKQGILLDSTNLALIAPGTAGFSTNYLVEATYQEVDTNLSVLPFYNSANPSQAFAGMGNNGQALSTLRQGSVAITLKAGISAATGSQTTPAPDAGYVGLWVITVANGQASITAPNISMYVGAPFVNNTLLGNSPAFSFSPLVPVPPNSDSTLKAAPTSWVQALVNAAAQGIAPAGTIIAYSGSVVPAGYLAIPSAATNLSRATYAALFAAIGTVWGAGDGVTTFGMPFLPAGYTFIQGALGAQSVGQVLAHTHPMPYQIYGQTYPSPGGGTAGFTGTAAASVSPPATSSTGGTANLAAGSGIQFCVKY